ncbi:MAG: type I methionyl aminopeptidase [Pseudomonadales bacterium]|nr:type I methionyl aminopeptidase [Pseudomonadales bacterium]
MNARTQNDFAHLRASGAAVRHAFDAMRTACKPGMTTAELDAIGAQILAEHDAVSAPQYYYDFPGTTCISLNEQAAHGIPGDTVIAAGDMINIDVSANRRGFVADMGESFVVGEGSIEQQRICAAVQEAVAAALAMVRAGRSLNVIGRAVQKIADREGYTIVRNLGSHGVGRHIHEEPSYIPYDNPEERRVLTRGMVITIEPFFSTGVDWVFEEDDGWTLSVPAGHLVAQFEHTLIVTDRRPVVVTEKQVGH